MKKILFALLALFTFASCEEKHEDVIYEIALATESRNVVTGSNSQTGPSLIAPIFEEFASAMTSLAASHKSEWFWVVSTDGSYSGADKDAKAKFEKAVPEFRKLQQTYQSRIDACAPEANTEGDYKFVLKLSRQINGTSELAAEPFEVKYN